MQFILNDSRNAIATLVIFIAAGSRIGPAILRVQQGVIQIAVSIGNASATIEMIRRLREVKRVEECDDVFDIKHEGFVPEISVSELNFYLAFY